MAAADFFCESYPAAVGARRCSGRSPLLMMSTKRAKRIKRQIKKIQENKETIGHSAYTLHIFRQSASQQYYFQVYTTQVVFSWRKQIWPLQQKALLGSTKRLSLELLFC